MTFASIKGGVAPVDLGSVDATKEDSVCVDFYAEGSETRKLVDTTVKLSTVTDLSGIDAVFFVGGFGTMWDFPDDPDVQRIVKDMYEANKVVSAVCHGPCALVNVKLSDGSYLVAGKTVAAFTNAEEDAVQRRNKVRGRKELSTMEALDACALHCLALEVQA
jgi:putative intracellular protease/amidase